MKRLSDENLDYIEIIETVKEKEKREKKKTIQRILEAKKNQYKFLRGK